VRARVEEMVAQDQLADANPSSCFLNIWLRSVKKPPSTFLLIATM
jgi:hypothetical protein